MKPFILIPRAKQDVNDIWDYIANDTMIPEMCGVSWDFHRVNNSEAK